MANDPFMAAAFLFLVGRAQKRGIEVGGKEWFPLVAKWCINEMDQARRDFGEMA